MTSRPLRIGFDTGFMRDAGLTVRDGIADDLQSKVRAMLVSLGLDDEVVPIEFEEGPRATAIAVDLCGGAERHFTTARSGDPGAISSPVFDWIFRNRDLLASAAVDALWARNSDAALEPDARNALADVLADAAIRGCDCTVPFQAFRAALADGCREIEQIVESLEPAFPKASTVRVALSPLGASELPIGQLVEVGREIRDRTGLLLPKLIPEIDESLQGTAFRIGIGRLLSPSIVVANEPLRAVVSRELALQVGPRMPLVSFEEQVGHFIKLSPMPMFNVFEAIGSVTLLRVVRALGREGVPVRDLRTIMESLLEIRGSIELRADELEDFHPESPRLMPRLEGEKQPPGVREFANYVRVRLAPQICGPLRRDDGWLEVTPLQTYLGARVAQLSAEPLMPGEVEQLAAAIARQVPAGRPAVLVAPYLHRANVQRELHRHLPGVQVLSRQELRGERVTERAA